MTDRFKQAALDYHRFPKAGKLAIRATKSLRSQQDLALAYSPGVAHPCVAIESHPDLADTYTARSNLVAVVTNGTAVLGLGAIGSLASKPVMEGKAVLFKGFADIDVFDIEVDETEPEAFIEAVARLEPTFGGINLEDIKAPDCFIIEQALKERMNIPVFHDDQHGTAIVVCAAVVNGLKLVGKRLSEVKLVTAGAGAAALACLNLLLEMGLKRENVIVTDIDGVVYQGREASMDPWKAAFASDTDARSLEQALDRADIFLGLSAAGVLKGEWLANMAADPLILALANPTPEIMPDEAKAIRPDAIIATGRSDFPNQVNNVLCFPFLFRGALDVGATEINAAMKMACVNALAELAQAEPNDIVRKAFPNDVHGFGREAILPKPFDPRLMEWVPMAVAKAAIESGVARRPYLDRLGYRDLLLERVYRTAGLMTPVFERSRQQCKVIAFADGENERVLQAAQQAVNEAIARPILIGRRGHILDTIQSLSLSMELGRDFNILDPTDNPRRRTYEAYYEQSGGESLSAEMEAARLGAIMLAMGEADGLIAGLGGQRAELYRLIERIIGLVPGIRHLFPMSAVVHDNGKLFITYTPAGEGDEVATDLMKSACLGVEGIARFRLSPTVVFIGEQAGANEEQVRKLLHERNSALKASFVDNAEAFFGNEPHDNHLVMMPNREMAEMALAMLKGVAGGVTVGPMLMGPRKPVHLLHTDVTVRGILNVTAYAVASA